MVDYLMPALGYQESLLPKWNAKHGHDVHIVTSDRYAPIEHYAESWGKLMGPRVRGPGTEAFEGVAVHRLPTTWEWRMRPWLKGLIEVIEGISPDVVFCHGSASPSAFRLARFASRTGVPLLMDNHMVRDAQNRTPLGRIYYFGLRALSRRLLDGNVHKVLGVADECAEFARSEQGIPAEYVDILPLGVDTDLFSPDEDGGLKAHREYGIPEDATVVLQTGKLDRGKGAHYLTEAMAPLMGARPHVWLAFVGGGSADYVLDATSHLERAGVADRSRLIPFVPVSRLSMMYSMADVCVYPAATSLSSLEAAACARPVVMTDLPASRWRASHGAGVCYRTGDVGSLRRIIEGLLDDPARRRAIGEAAREGVLKHFSYDTIARRSEKFMSEAIAASREVVGRAA